MIKQIYKKLYGKYWFCVHLTIMFIFNAFVIAIFKHFNIINNVFALINYDIVSLSGTIAGFEFAGVSILISLSGNQKLQILKDINSDKIIYQIMIYSLFFLIISIVFMVIDINIFDLTEMTNEYYNELKYIIEVISIITLELGYMLFVSSIQLLAWILK